MKQKKKQNKKLTKQEASKILDWIRRRRKCFFRLRTKT